MMVFFTYRSKGRVMPANPEDNPFGGYEEMELDEYLATLMRVILAFTPDFVDGLQRRDICDKIVVRYTTLLHRYLKRYYPANGRAKFAEAIMISAYAREATDIAKHRLTV